MVVEGVMKSSRESSGVFFFFFFNERSNENVL